MRGIHLTVTTPLAVLVEEEGVQSVRAEDASGSFGILPGHTEFLTVLPASVLRWRTAGGQLRFCALRSGLITVGGGDRVSVACREGILGDDLGALEEQVTSMRKADVDADRHERVEQLRLNANAVREMMRFLRPGQAGTDGASLRGPGPSGSLDL
jgi:F-type H+-transporting ATPase subunit epsilon